MGCAAALQVNPVFQARVLTSVLTVTSHGPTAMVLQTSWRPPLPSWLLRSSGAIFLQLTEGSGRRFQPLLRQHSGIWMPRSSQEHASSIAPVCQHVSHRMSPSISPDRVLCQCLCVPRDLPHPLTPQASTLPWHRPPARQPNSMAGSHRRNNTQQPQPGNTWMQECCYQTFSAHLMTRYFIENIPSFVSWLM